MVEQVAVNHLVAGSIPALGAIRMKWARGNHYYGQGLKRGALSQSLLLSAISDTRLIQGRHAGLNFVAPVSKFSTLNDDVFRTE